LHHQERAPSKATIVQEKQGSLSIQQMGRSQSTQYNNFESPEAPKKWLGDVDKQLAHYAWLESKSKRARGLGPNVVTTSMTRRSIEPPDVENPISHGSFKF
jgi:hypothetical protein